jgi:hypothetical protein
MSLIMVFINSLSTIAFVPNFAMIMRKLKKEYNHIYAEIKGRIITLFSLIMIFLIIRLYIYIDLKFYH